MHEPTVSCLVKDEQNHATQIVLLQLCLISLGYYYCYYYYYKHIPSVSWYGGQPRVLSGSSDVADIEPFNIPTADHTQLDLIQCHLYSASA